MTRRNTITRTTALALTALGLAVTPAAHAAKVEHYQGKTKEGTKITFEVKGPWVQRMHSSVPTTCVSAQGGTPHVTITDWEPAYNFRLGYKSKVKVDEGITRNYSIETHRKGKKVTGKLGVNFSRLVSNTFSGYHIDTCYGTANFSVRKK